MVASNPYAPPAASADNPHDHSWATEGALLLVRNGAVLPAVELETGDQGIHLVAEVRKSEAVTWQFMLLISFIGATGYFFLRSLPPLIFIVAAGMIGVLFQSLAGRFLPGLTVVRRHQFLTFRNPVLIRKRKRLFTLILLSLMGWIWLIAFACWWTATHSTTEITFPLALIGVIGMIAFLVLLIRLRPKIEIRQSQGGMVKLRNASPEALRILKEIEHTRDTSPQPM